MKDGELDENGKQFVNENSEEAMQDGKMMWELYENEKFVNEEMMMLELEKQLMKDDGSAEDNVEH